MNYIFGRPVSNVKFQAVASLNELCQLGLKNPVHLEASKLKQLDNDEVGARQLREQINRRFDKARLLRVVDYSDYIRRVENGDHQMGGAPAMTVFISGKSEVEQVLASPTPVIPALYGLKPAFGATVVTPDGETQLAARFLLRDGDAKRNIPAMPETGDWPIAVTVYFNCGEQFASAILHDYNGHATPVPEKTLAALNTTGKLTEAVHAAIEQAGFDPRRDVNERGDRGGAKRKVAFSQLLAAAAAFALDDKALRSAVGDPDLKRLQVAARPEQLDGFVPATVELLRSPALAHAKNASLVTWQVASALAKTRGSKLSQLNWGGLPQPALLKAQGIRGAAATRDAIAKALSGFKVAA